MFCGHWPAGRPWGPSADPSVEPASKETRSHDHAVDRDTHAIVNPNLVYDRVGKASLYAKYGQPELWIVMPSSEKVEICRNPQPDLAAWTLHDFGNPLTTLFAPDKPITIRQGR